MKSTAIKNTNITMATLKKDHHNKKQQRSLTGLKLFFCLITIITFSAIFTSCEEKPKDRIIIWTDCSEFAQYCELFNKTHPDNKAVLVYKENPALAIPPAKDELPPDIIIGSWLRSDYTQKYFKSLDYLFDHQNLSYSIFYEQLINAGKVRKHQYLLPVSFNLPAIIFSNQNSNLITDNYNLTPAQLRLISSEFNQQNKNGNYTKIGFIPSADSNFLYTLAKLNGANFREEKNEILYDKDSMEFTINYLRDWIEKENTSAQVEQDFAFKYLFMPDYRQVTSGRTLFASTTSSYLFKTMKDMNLDIDYRWLADGSSTPNTIPIEDNFTMLGIYKDAQNQPGASEFITWFFDSTTQEQIISRKVQLQLNTELFGIAGGFSSIRDVTEHILPIYYTHLLTNLPPAENLIVPEKLPARWDTYRNNVIEQYISTSITTEDLDSVPSMAEYEAEWQKKVFDN